MISEERFVKVMHSYYKHFIPSDVQFLYNLLKSGDTWYGRSSRDLLINVHPPTVLENYDLEERKQLQNQWGEEFPDLNLIKIPDSDYVIRLQSRFCNLDFRPLTPIRKYICMYVHKYIEKHRGCELNSLFGSLFDHEDFTRKIPKLFQSLSEYWGDEGLRAALTDFVEKEAREVLKTFDFNQFNSKILTKEIEYFVTNTFYLSFDGPIFEEYDWDEL